MAGELNTSLKEVNDIITQIDKNAQSANKRVNEILNGRTKIDLSGLKEIQTTIDNLLALDSKLSARRQKGKIRFDYGIDPEFVKQAGQQIESNLTTIGNRIAQKASEITMAALTTAKKMAYTQISSSSEELSVAGTTVAKGIRDALIAQIQSDESELSQRVKALATRISAQIRASYMSGVATSASNYGYTQAGSLVPVESNPFSPTLNEINQSDWAGSLRDTANSLKKSLEDLKVPEEEIEERIKELYNTVISATRTEMGQVSSLVAQYEQWSTTLNGLREKQMELNVKRESGLISDRDATTQQIELINQMRTAKEGIARVDKTTEQAEREMAQKQTSDIRRLNDLWNDNRHIRTRINEIESKPVNERTASENTLLQTLNDTLTIQKDELKQLQTQYRGVAEAQHVFSEQAIKDLENKIKAERDLAKQNAPKVSLGSTTGDVTTVSGAYRTQIKLYEEENRLLREQQAIRKELQNRSTTDADEKHLESIDKRLKQIKKDRESIANTQLFKSASDQAKLDYAAKQTGEIRRRTNEAMMATAAWARENARVATTYQQLKFAADNIRNVLQNTDLTKLEARQLVSELNKVEKKIQDCEKSMGTFKEQSRSLLDTVSQLAMGFGIMFSLQAVSQFARKIVEIRGEFELQEVALKAIVQDSLKGQQIWNETVQNALKSPFSVKQLVTYTKQLAAYRIETDKLTDTTKRLADISAGLGVDMQRLILAYGQVKAAAYLRASEVRQFTEAGINMYGELSKYFSEIEGRAVSTADVVERVSKRMVSFEDVAVVFQRLTDEGGTFYNMQEIQSETVRGQVMKLRDAFDIMLNDIGEKNQGVIKNIVSALLNLTKSWQKIEPIIMGVLGALLSYKVLIPMFKTISNGLSVMIAKGMTLNKSLQQQGVIVKATTINWKRFRVEMQMANAQGTAFTVKLNLMKFGFKTLGIAAKGAGRAIKMAFMSNPFGIILTLVTSIAAVIADIASKSDEWSASLNKAIESSAEEVIDMQTKFNKLAQTAIGSSDFDEREKALNSLKTQFGEILPAYMLENQYLEENAGRYDVAAKAIENYVNKKNEAKAIDDMRNDLTTGDDGISENSGDMISAFTGRMLLNNEKITRYQAALIESRFETFLQQAEDINAITEKMMEDELNKIVSEVTGSNEMAGYGMSGTSSYGGRVSKNARELLENYQEIAGREEEIHRRFEENTSEAQKAVNLIKEGNQEELDNVKQKTTTFNILLGKHNEYLKVQQKIKDIEAQGDDGDKGELKTLKARLKVLQSYEDELNTISNSASKYAEFMKGDGTFADYIEAVNMSFDAEVKTLDEQLAEFKAKKLELQNQIVTEKPTEAQKAANTEIEAAIADIDVAVRAAEEKRNEVLNSWAYSWNEATEKAVKELNLDTADQYIKRYVQQLAADGSKNIKAHGKQLRANQKEIDEELEMINRLIADGQEEFVRNVLKISDETIENLKKVREESKRQADLILGPEKDKKGGQGKDPFNDRLNVLKEMFSEARKLNKELYGTAVSADKIVTQYKKAFEAAFGKTSGNRKANALWTEVQRQLEKNWNGGENTQQLVEALRKMKESGFVNKKNMPAFEKFLSQMEVEVTLSDRKDSREKFKKDFDQWMSDLNLSKELEKMGTPVEFYELFGLKKEDQTVAVIRKRVEDYYNTLRDANGKLGDEDAKQREETLRKLADMEDKEKRDRMKTYLKYVMAELNEVEKAYYEFEHARNEINKAFAGEDEEIVKARENALLGANKDFQKKIAKTRWNDLKSSDMYTMLFSDLDNIADETLDQMKKTLVDFLNEPGIKQNLTSSELRHIQEQLDKIDQLEQKRHPFKYLADDFNVFWKQLSQGAKSNAIEKQRAQLEKVAKMRLEYQRLEARVGEAKANAGDGFEADAAYQAAKKAANEYEEQLREQERQLDDDTRAVNRFRQAQERLSTSLEKAGNDLKTITNAGTSLYTNWMKMTGRMNQANDQVVASINQMANDIGDAIGNIAKIIASEGSDVTAWIGLVASIGSIISDGIDINEAALDKEIKELDKRLSNISRRIELFEKQMDRATNMDDYFKNYNAQMSELSAKLGALQEQYNAESKKKNPDSEALEGYRASMDEVYEEQRALREKMTQEWGGIGESSWRSASEEFVDAWMQAFQETGDGLSGLQDNFDEFVKNLFKKQATMRIANMMLQPLFDMIDKATEDGTFTRSELDAVRQRAAQIFPELNEALKGLWDELGIGMDATDTLSGLQQGIQGITEATAEVIEGYLNSIRFFIAEDNMMLRQIRDAVLSGAQSASYAILSRIDENVRRIWDKLSDITMPNQTANTMAVRIVA